MWSAIIALTTSEWLNGPHLAAAENDLAVTIRSVA
jgi:hypothetical protein